MRAVAAAGKIETAHRLAGRVQMVLDYAIDLGIIESHAGSGLTRVLTSRTSTRMASLPVADVPELMRAISSYADPVTRIGLLLVAHVFVRTKEVRAMRWADIRRDDGVWVVPAEAMKMRLPHVVPLSRHVLAMLDELEQYTGDCVHVLASSIKPTAPVSENTLLFALPVAPQLVKRGLPHADHFARHLGRHRNRRAARVLVVHATSFVRTAVHAS